MESRWVQVGDVRLHVGVTGHGPDVVVLSGGPGCVQYLERDDIAPPGYRAWYPEPRGVGRSEGGPHTMERAVEDLEAIRRTLGLTQWLVVGHSWGADLAVRYALDRPTAVAGLIGVAGHGLHRDRTWSAEYEARKATQPVIDIAWNPEVHAALGDSFTQWVHQQDLWRSLADCSIPMQIVAAGDDIRPSWPLAQLVALMPGATFVTVDGVPHDFWSTHPAVWVATLTDGLHAVTTPRVDDPRDPAGALTVPRVTDRRS